MIAGIGTNLEKWDRPGIQSHSKEIIESDVKGVPTGEKNGRL
jgi:hypothetical protein